jgi:hypothetical protein
MAAIDVTGSGPGISLTKDIFVNNSLIGPFDSTSDVEVFLQNGSGTPIVPTSSILVGNDLTITANIPVASGVALQRPTPSSGISYRNYDTGWRAQNGWYAYNPPTYPAKYAQLDTTLGVNQWYRLKTALTVNGVSSTNRFVDLSGVQGWPALNNLNYAVLDKLTGLMFTRAFISIVSGSSNWIANINAAFANSQVINGNTYSDWYQFSAAEAMSLFGLYLGTGTNFVDPISSLSILTGVPTTGTNPIVTADGASISPAATTQGYLNQNATGGTYTSVNTNVALQYTLWVHDASNLIS